MIVMANGYFSFYFNFDDNLKSSLLRGLWMLGMSSLALKKWKTSFNPKDWKCNEAPIWVYLLGLPLEYWDEEIFYGLVAYFGELLSLDPMMMAK